MNVITASFPYLPVHVWEDRFKHRCAIRTFAVWPLRSRSCIKFEQELLQYMKEGSYSVREECYGLQMNALSKWTCLLQGHHLFPNVQGASGASMSFLSGGRFHRNCEDLPFLKFVCSVRSPCTKVILRSIHADMHATQKMS